MSLDIYKIPRERIDVARIGGEFARYLQMIGEDTEYLSYDPTRRDRLFAQLYNMEGVKPDIFPESFVPFGTDPDEYFRLANEQIAQLTPPQTFEDRVKRLHFAWPALSVYYQYKITYGLVDEPKLMRQVEAEKERLMSAWYRDVFPVLFPDRVKSKAPSTTPQSRSTPGIFQPTPPPTRRSATPKRISVYEVEQFLNSPHTLLGKKFVHTPPVDEDQSDCGTFEVMSYSVRMGDEGSVEHEFQVLLEAFGGDPVPMDRGDVFHLLKHSTIAV